MKNVFKKICSICVLTTLCTSICVPAYADDVEHESQINNAASTCMEMKDNIVFEKGEYMQNGIQYEYEQERNVITGTIHTKIYMLKEGQKTLDEEFVLTQENGCIYIDGELVATLKKDDGIATYQEDYVQYHSGQYLDILAKESTPAQVASILVSGLITTSFAAITYSAVLSIADLVVAYKYKNVFYEQYLKWIAWPDDYPTAVSAVENRARYYSDATLYSPIGDWVESTYIGYPN